MSILKEAIACYKSKNYKKALHLFELAGERYGGKFVQANIQLCKKAIAASPVEQEKNLEPHALEFNKLDPATVLLLANNGDIQISDELRQQYLNRYKVATQRKSEDVPIKMVNPIPSDWPKDLVLAPLPESTNDFEWHAKRIRSTQAKANEVYGGLSIIIPTFNRRNILDVTLACLANQKTKYFFEVVVADDGSKEAIMEIVKKYESKLDIKYVRQKDFGYQLCAVRNLGLRTAKYEFISILDCDMAPNPLWVQSYMDLLIQDEYVALIGPRKYVDTSMFSGNDFLANSALIESLQEIVTNNNVAGKIENTISVDWRLDHFAKTENLRLCDTPFRFFSGGNVAFAKKWLNIVGGFDEEFTHWGGEDNEFGYRLYRAGCFFRAVDGGMAYHQEPPGKENETDRAEGKKITINIVREKVPYFYRKLVPVASAHIHKVPLVSIYIPAYNCSDYIVRCVDSALNQTVVDLEVCVCDDGSTDNTLDLLELNYGQNPRVRVMSKSNGGIGTASNGAVKMARGFYIGQLDSDDYLEPDAIDLCLKEFFADQKLACVYTTNRNVSPDDTLIAKGYNWPLYSREKLTTAMIAHHFRMFTLRAWNLTDGFDEKIANAIDYDMYLKLSEIGPFKHVNKICYNRILHGENTSIKKIGLQKENHFKVVNHSLARQDIANYRYAPADIENDSSRKYQFERLIKSKNLLHQSNASHKINFTHAENIYTEPYLWLSLGENCLPDDILKRHNKKSFSTIYSSGRTNIDYALYLENKNYIDLLDSRNLDYGDAWGKKVVRSTNIIKCDDIFEPGCSKGFEFTHHDPISSAKDRESCERKIQRLQEARGNNNIVFLYFHRSNQKTNIEKLSIKLKELADHYTKNNKNCIIAFFHQVIIQEKNTRNLEINKHPNGILEFIFLTEKIWGGTDPELLWARSDDDLIRLMIQAVSSAKRNRSVNGSNLKVAGPSQAYEKRLPTAC